MTRAIRRTIPAAVVLLAAGLLPAAAASARTTPVSRHARATVLAAKPDLAHLLAAPRPGHFGPAATGENPPGRVTQIPGYAGYYVPDGASTSDSETLTLPTVACNTGSNPAFGDVTSSEPVPGVLIQAGNSLVQVQIFWDCRSNSYDSWSTLDPSCSSQGCPLSGWANGFVSAGDVVDIQASTSPSASSTTISDLTSGASAAFTAAGTTATSTSAVFSLTDYCFLPLGGAGTVAETCNEDDSSSPVPPPGYGNFSPVAYSNAEVDGTGLGSYLAGPSSAGWQQDISVWGSTLVSETSYVGGGSSYTITNPETTLPSLTVSDPSIDKPATGSADLAFVASLSSGSSNTIYLDYSTQDHTAFAGQDYQGESGTLEFPAGTLSETIDVPVISGPSGGQNGNEVDFYLNFSNPSYVASGGSGLGTIYEGPIVFSVSPGAVPLNGGPDTTITVTGVDFGPAGSGDSVQFCPSVGGGSCLDGIGTVVDADTSLTVAAPDASSSVLDNQKTLTTDTIVTATSSIKSPVNGNDQLAFGCEVQAVTDGSFQAFGCLTDEAGGNDVAEVPTQVDGVDVSATKTDAVTYATSSGAVDSTGSVTVSLPLLGNKAVQIFKGALTKSLSSPVTFSVPANTVLAGLAISGNLTLTPGSIGQASGSVTVTLPGVLGGGTGTLTFQTATNQGLTNLSIAVPKANFMQLFSLTKVTLTYDSTSGTWSVAGTASTGGGASTTFAGTLVYPKGGSLTSASLDIGTISLAGLLEFSKIHVGLAKGAWSGSGTITQTTSTGTESATLSLAFDSNGKLTSADIKTKAVTLFGVIDLQSFDMKYSGSSWSLAVVSNLPGGGTSSASLAVANGVISQATLVITKVAFLKKVTIDTATISYSAKEPNPQCSGVTGAEIWCGNWQISLPQASIVTGVGGSLAFANAQFAQASVTVNGNVPLAEGVFLTQLTGRLQINPPPTVVSGGATITFGPQISNVSALSLTGQLTRSFPTGTTGGFYDFQGSVTALPGSSHALVLGTADVKAEDSGKATVALQLGGGAAGLQLTLGHATATVIGTLNGTFNGTSFSLASTVTVSVPLFPSLSGSMKADNKGIAACAKTSSSTQVGFEYFWQTGTLQIFDTKGCSDAGF